MRILFITPYVPSLIRVRPYQFLRQLGRRHDVTLVSAGAASATDAIDDLREMCRRVEIVPLRLASSLRSCASAALRGEPLQSAVCQTPELHARLQQILAVDAFDVAHIEHLRAAQVVTVLPAGLPRLFDAVDSISLLLERTLRSSHSLRQRALALIELRRTRRFEGRIVRRFQSTIVTSAEDGQLLRELSGCEVRVIPNGVDLDYFQPLRQPREAETIVFSGKMSYHANVTAVLHFAREIWPRVRAAHPRARLWIVGSNPPKAVRGLAQDPAITVSGHVADLRPYVGRAAVAVCPMVVKVGIQNKLLEAMAMATPSVATSAGMSGLQALPGRDVLVAETPEMFAAHIGRLFDQPELAATVGHAGLRYVQAQHQWSVAGEHLEAELNRISTT